MKLVKALPLQCDLAYQVRRREKAYYIGKVALERVHE